MPIEGSGGTRIRTREPALNPPRTTETASTMMARPHRRLWSDAVFGHHISCSDRSTTRYFLGPFVRRAWSIDSAVRETPTATGLGNGTGRANACQQHRDRSFIGSELGFDLSRACLSTCHESQAGRQMLRPNRRDLPISPFHSFHCSLVRTTLARACPRVHTVADSSSIANLAVYTRPAQVYRGSRFSFALTSPNSRVCRKLCPTTISRSLTKATHPNDEASPFADPLQSPPSPPRLHNHYRKPLVIGSEVASFFLLFRLLKTLPVKWSSFCQASNRPEPCRRRAPQQSVSQRQATPCSRAGAGTILRERDLVPVR